jgi:hypothetical protein
VGNTVVNEGDPLTADVFAHETKHADQWAIFGTLLGPAGFPIDYDIDPFTSWVLTGH